MAASAHIPYEIISQDLTEDLMPNGSFQDVWRITFQGPSGTIQYVRIPASQYAPLAVDSMIQAELNKTEGVHALGSAPPADLGIAPE